MFRSNKINLASANDIINSLLESSEIMSGTGAVVITQKNGRKTTNTGTIYLRDGLIYAAHIDNHRVPIAQRIATGALVAKDDLNEAVAKAGGDTTSPRIVDYLLQNQMISDKILSSYVKEHFIEILGKIMSWDDSLGEWHPNAMTKDFLMPFVTFARIRDILDHRKQVYGEFLRLTEKFMRPEELPELTFALLKPPTAQQSPTSRRIISLCDSKHTLDDIATATGVTFYNVFQTIVGLWREGLLALNIGGIRLPYTSVLAEPETEPELPPIVHLTNPPIPVHDEPQENLDDVDDRQDSEDGPAEESDAPNDEQEEWASHQGQEPENTDEKDESDDQLALTNDYYPDNEKDEEPESSTPAADPGDGYVGILDDYNYDLDENPHQSSAVLEDDTISGLDDFEEAEPTSSQPGIAQSASGTTEFVPPLTVPQPSVDETMEPAKETAPAATGYSLPKDILDRKNKVAAISNRLNELEAALASCENDLRENQAAQDVLSEKKARLQRELAEVEQDSVRVNDEADRIKETYQSIRKEVEDTINSFKFLEGE